MNLNEFISYYENHSDRFVQEKYNLSKSKLKQYLKENNIIQHTKSENTKLTNLQLYGCTNVMTSPKVKQHFKDLYGGSGSPFNKKEIRDKRDKTVKDKYGVDNIFQVKEIKDKIKEVQTKKYGGMGYISSYQRDKYHKYKYNDVYFDSSYELALWIYANDHNEEIIREPIHYKYIFDDKEYTYTPDFKYKDEIIEIKGDHLLGDDTLIDPTHKSSPSKLKCKYNCMLENNVKIVTGKDLKFALSYAKSKFNDKL